MVNRSGKPGWLPSSRTIRSRLRNLLKRIGKLYVALGFKSYVCHRDYSAKPPACIRDGDAANLLLAHLANRFMHGVISSACHKVFAHGFARRRSACVASFGYHAANDVAVCDYAYQSPAIHHGDRADAVVLHLVGHFSQHSLRRADGDILGHNVAAAQVASLAPAIVASVITLSRVAFAALRPVVVTIIIITPAQRLAVVCFIIAALRPVIVTIIIVASLVGPVASLRAGEIFMICATVAQVIIRMETVSPLAVVLAVVARAPVLAS